jgi:hypothetical protein
MIEGSILVRAQLPALRVAQHVCDSLHRGPLEQVAVPEMNFSTTPAAKASPDIHSEVASTKSKSISGVRSSFSCDGHARGEVQAGNNHASQLVESFSSKSRQADRSAPLCFDGLGLSLTKVRDLFFGSIVSGSKAGTVTSPPIGAGSCSGSVILEPDVNTGAAHFVYTIQSNGSSDNKKHLDAPDGNDWENSAPISIILPSSITIRRLGSSETMLVDDFKWAANHNDLYVGATLHVNAKQRRGSYTGLFPIMVIVN